MSEEASPTEEQYQARLLKRAAYIMTIAWLRDPVPAWDREDWKQMAGRWMSDYERMNEVVDMDDAQESVAPEPANGLFGPGIFGTGIDLSALDADTAWRLGLWIGQLVGDKEKEIQSLKKELKQQKKSQMPTRYRDSGMLPVMAPRTEFRLLEDLENVYVISAVDLARGQMFYDRRPAGRVRTFCGAKHDHGRCGLPADGHKRHRAKTVYGEVEWEEDPDTTT